MAAEIVDRLGEFLAHKKLNHLQLSQKLGYKSSEKISRLFRHDNALPSADIIIDISNLFVNELSIEWWITGRGQMIKSYQPEYLSILNEPMPAYGRKKIKEEQERLRNIANNLRHISDELEQTINIKKVK